MTYSCADFTDSILKALDINVPEHCGEWTDFQADAALSAIARLHAIEDAARAVMERWGEGNMTQVMQELHAMLEPDDFEWPSAETV